MDKFILLVYQIEYTCRVLIFLSLTIETNHPHKNCSSNYNSAVCFVLQQLHFIISHSRHILKPRTLLSAQPQSLSRRLKTTSKGNPYKTRQSSRDQQNRRCCSENNIDVGLTAAVALLSSCSYQPIFTTVLNYIAN